MKIFENTPLAHCCFIFICLFCFGAYIPLAIKIMVILCAVIATVLLFSKRRYIAMLMAVVAISFAFGIYFYDIHINNAVDAEDGISEFRITEIQFCDDSVAYLDGKADTGYKYHYTVNNPPEIKVGDILRGDVRYEIIAESDDFDTERYYNSKDIWLNVTVDNVEIVGHKSNILLNTIKTIREYCIRCFEKYTYEDTVGLLSALSIGDKSKLDPSITRDFGRAGLSHVLAISGMHMSVIMGAVALLGRLLHLNRRLRSSVIIGLCIGYMMISGFSSSVVRAGVMFILMSIAVIIGVESDALTNLMVAVTAIIIFSPCSVFDIGLILSFTSTFGIVVIVGEYMNKISRDDGIILGAYKYILISVLTSVSALAFSFLPLLVYFDTVSLISVLSNLIIAPIVSLVLVLIPVFLSISFIPFAGRCLGFVLSYITEVFIWVVEFLSSIRFSVAVLDYPFIKYTFIAILAGVVIAFLIKKRYALIMPYLCWFVTFCVLIACWNIPLLDSCEVIMYSEKSSDAVFVKTLGGNIYFDFGSGSYSSEQRAFDTLEDRFYSVDIDCWVVANYTDGLYTCANELMNQRYIHYIYLPEPYDSESYYIAEELEYYAAKENVDIVYYDYNDILELNGLSVTMYYPVWFEDSDVYISSMKLCYGTRELFYAGRGYFDHRDADAEYDILFLGDCGSKRKLQNLPDISATYTVVGDSVDFSSENVDGYLRMLSPNTRYIEYRMKNIY
ncbi:MAG: ComEC/Rec2 family competence protein [Clostridia bacterium]|nr:ComEC/Rec2 family competence protein [Clostridia bacterium]